MLGQSGHDLIHRHVEDLADAQERDDGKGPSSLNHLPMAETESEADHVLLGKRALGPVGANAVAQGFKESGVMGWQRSGSTHSFTLVLDEQKYHEQKCVLCDSLSFPPRKSPLLENHHVP